VPATGFRRLRRRLPHRTIRLRLTLLYGATFLVAGTALLAITYGLVARSVTGRAHTVFVTRTAGEAPAPPPPPDAGIVIAAAALANGRPAQIRTLAGQVDETFRKLTAAQAQHLAALKVSADRQIADQRHAQLAAMLAWSALALGIMAIASIGLGWLMAGRALRPVRTMSGRARGISERNLHERLALGGPDDELKELSDTFDGLLERLEAAFESQRRFVAHASHELRTPITLERTLVEVALADPGATLPSMRDTCARVLAATEQQERMIEALLTLARSQRGLERREPLDLATVAREAVAASATDAVGLDLELGSAWTSGDEALLERLASNLVDNAVRYNEPGGWISVRTGIRDGSPTLEVANSGRPIDPNAVAELTEPFRRLQCSGGRDGLGLGLSIVHAISVAHGASFHAAAPPEGGLRVTISFGPTTAPLREPALSAS